MAKVRVLHIPQKKIGLKGTIGGIKTVLLDEVKWENKLEGIDAKIYIYDRIEEKNNFFLNKTNSSLKIKDILEYKPDFIIFHGFYDIEHYKISRVLRKNKLPYYIKPHGGFNEKAYKSSFITYIKKMIANLLIFNNFVKNSNGILFLNKLEQKNSIFHKEKEYFLPNGIDSYNLIVDENKIDKILKIGYLGRIDIKNKGLNEILDFFFENKKSCIDMGIRVILYGKVRKNSINQLKKYEILLEGLLEINPPVYGELKNKKLQELDIVFLNSKFEGMSMLVLESLSFGIPCLLSEETGFLNNKLKNKCVWSIKEKLKSKESFFKFITDFKKNKEIYRENAKKSSQNYHWERIIEKYKNVYEDIKNETNKIN